MALNLSMRSTSKVPSISSVESTMDLIPIIDITDLYHPFQDPGDNLDLVHAFTLPQVDLRAIILDTTEAFRKPVANAPHMWQDPNGPREPGIIPVNQLNYIFNRRVPFAVGPFTAMKTTGDTKVDTPSFQQSGVHLLLETLESSKEPIEILSFGSTRTIAVALNRDENLFHRKVARIHISAGTATDNFELGSLQDQNEMPGGEWNVALDPLAFIRLLRSDLPIALYPCSTKNGAFSYGPNNTYWKFHDLTFVEQLEPKLRNYVMYALGRLNRPDFLACLDGQLSLETAADRLIHPHHVWETAIWLAVTRQKLVLSEANEAFIVPMRDTTPGLREVLNALVPCDIQVRSDGRFSFHPTTAKTNFSIFRRDDPIMYEAASRQAWTKLWTSYRTDLPR